jgi:hypothetical protein
MFASTADTPAVPVDRHAAAKAGIPPQGRTAGRNDPSREFIKLRGSWKDRRGMVEPVDAREHDPLDDQDDLYDTLAIKLTGWTLRSSEDGEEVPASREEIAKLLADGRRMNEGLSPEGLEFYPSGTD